MSALLVSIMMPAADLPSLPVASRIKTGMLDNGIAYYLVTNSTEKVQVNVISKAVGQISENDVMLASASDAIIVGFQVRPSSEARKLADREGVEINTYSIIYDAIDDIKAAMVGMLDKVKKEVVTAEIEVKQVYKISKVGTVAGGLVNSGS